MTMLSVKGRVKMMQSISVQGFVHTKLDGKDNLANAPFEELIYKTAFV